MSDLVKKDSSIINNDGLIISGFTYDDYNKVKMLYQEGLNELLNEIMQLKQVLNGYCDYEMISNVTYRIKTYDSIVNKMKKKKYNLNVTEAINNINDIAGIRIVCNYEDDIYKIKDILAKLPNIGVIEEKDYLKNAKKSGYKAYHMIVQIPIKISEETLFIKVEIQIRTALMDFWSATEHKIKYKAKNKLSKLDSKKLCFYAKIMDTLGSKMTKIFRKQLRTE